MPGKLVVTLTTSRPITMAAEHTSMNTKGRRARPASLGASSIVGLKFANATLLTARLLQDAHKPLPVDRRESFHHHRTPASPKFTPNLTFAPKPAWRGQ